eukprot:366230-Chlamydomonas_euryale.AAC.28
MHAVAEVLSYQTAMQCATPAHAATHMPSQARRPGSHPTMFTPYHVHTLPCSHPIMLTPYHVHTLPAPLAMPTRGRCLTHNKRAATLVLRALRSRPCCIRDRPAFVTALRS